MELLLDFLLDELDLRELLDDFFTFELLDLLEADLTLDVEDRDLETLPLRFEDDDERFTFEELLLLEEFEDLFTDPDLEVLPDFLTPEDPLLFEPEDRETEPEDLLLEDPVERTLTLLPELFPVFLLVTPDELVVRTLLELLVLFTLLRPLFVTVDEELLLFNEERFVLRSYFCVKPLLLGP